MTMSVTKQQADLFGLSYAMHHDAHIFAHTLRLTKSWIDETCLYRVAHTAVTKIYNWLRNWLIFLAICL